MLESSHKDVKPHIEIILFLIMQLPSLALDSGIHARMTDLKIVASDKEYLPEIINTFTVSKAIGLLREC